MFQPWQLSSPRYLLATRSHFPLLVLIPFLLSYLCASFNLPNIFRLSGCPCPSQNPLEPSSHRFSLSTSFFPLPPLHKTMKIKEGNICTYIFVRVPPRRNLKLMMVNYIRPESTEPREHEGVFFSFAARAATWLLAADPWRGNEQRALGLCPSELYCYRYEEEWRRPSPLDGKERWVNCERCRAHYRPVRSATMERFPCEPGEIWIHLRGSGISIVARYIVV